MVGKESLFGILEDGSETKLFTLINDNSMSVTISNFGATITSIIVPGRDGKLEDVVLGFEDLTGYKSSEYVKSNPYFGGTIGRYSNRIKGGRFSLKGKDYQVTQNEGGNSLHGGACGFDKKLWKAEAIEAEGSVGVEMTLESPDGDEGYPGNLEVKVRFYLANDNSLSIDYSAVSDQDTIISLTNHSYFNLRGAGNGPVLHHHLCIPGNKCLELAEDAIPTGTILDVANSSLDFTESIRIEDAMKLNGNDKVVGCYAHTWLLNENGDDLKNAATLVDPESGRVLEINTTEPGILLYTGDGLDGSITGKDGKMYSQYAGLCLEPQQLPNAPNHQHFSWSMLKAGENFSSKTVYNFTIH